MDFMIDHDQLCLATSLAIQRLEREFDPYSEVDVVESQVRLLRETKNGLRSRLMNGNGATKTQGLDDFFGAIDSAIQILNSGSNSGHEIAIVPLVNFLHKYRNND